MSKIKAWLSAARLRTLPLSISGILTGTALAGNLGYFDTAIFILALLTTTAFQITSNFANDYGDGVKGTDNADRIGPQRAYQSGLLTRKELKSGILLSIGISLVLVILLLYVTFGLENWLYFSIFTFLGLLSVWAAVTYTVGNSAYGYKGLGDVFVFLFFGVLAVLGTLFLYTRFLTYDAILPAITIGALCTGVINLNNLRDYASDKKANKVTMIVKMGYDRGKQYHTFLLGMAFLSLVVFTALHYKTVLSFTPLLSFIPIFFHWKRVRNCTTPSTLDPELKILALSTFLLSLLFFISFNFFL